MIACKNCGQLFSTPYCPSCGQRATVARIEWKTIARDLPQVLFGLDRGFLFNVVQLYKRPGYAMLDYLAGKRKEFYHPVSYILIVLGAMLLAMNLLHVHYYDPVQDAGMSPEDTAFWSAYDATQQRWISQYKFFIPFYLPAMALLFLGWLRVLGRKLNYWECVVISCFESAQMTIQQIVILVAVYVVNSTSFARFSDMAINNLFLVVLYFFQFYQLANPELKKGFRVTGALIGAILLLSFAYVAIYGFQEFNNQVG